MTKDKPPRLAHLARSGAEKTRTLWVVVLVLPVVICALVVAIGVLGIMARFFVR